MCTSSFPTNLLITSQRKDKTLPFSHTAKYIFFRLPMPMKAAAASIRGRERQQHRKFYVKAGRSGRVWAHSTNGRASHPSVHVIVSERKMFANLQPPHFLVCCNLFTKFKSKSVFASRVCSFARSFVRRWLLHAFSLLTTGTEHSTRLMVRRHIPGHERASHGSGLWDDA